MNSNWISALLLGSVLLVACRPGERTGNSQDTAHAVAAPPASAASAAPAPIPHGSGPLVGDTLDLSSVGDRPLQNALADTCDPVVPLAFQRFVFLDDSVYHRAEAVHPACLEPRPATLDTEVRVGSYRLHGDTLTLFTGVGREIDEMYNGHLFQDSVVQFDVERAQLARYTRRRAAGHSDAAAAPETLARPLRDRWDSADAATVRLPPTAFPQLPLAVRSDLERRQCTVPQAYDDTTPANVVSGAFRRAGETDWAVLCSRNDTSRILVYWGGPPGSPDSLASEPDRSQLQGGVGTGIGYSRALGVASPAYIRKHYEWYGGSTPPPLDHEGINDIFVEKASVVWYWYNGHWLSLTGAD